MNISRAVTYSLLAHLRSNGALAQGPLDIFQPLVKRAISDLLASGVHKGKSVLEIVEYCNALYGIDLPIVVVKTILERISNEYNQEGHKRFVLYQDGSFIIDKYVFTEFDDLIATGTREVDNLNILFAEFCKLYNYERKEKETIVSFIDQHKVNLSRFLAHRKSESTIDFTVEAQFVEHFKKHPPVYNLIRKIYLGSVLSSYAYYNPTDVKMDVELLLDTNFIVSLIDLNTPESTHTCRKLVEVSKRLGYKFSVMLDTIEETKSLIMSKAENFDTSYLVKLVNPEDIFNACERRKLSRIDLERIADGVKVELEQQGFHMLTDMTKFSNIAKFSKEYEVLKRIRNNPRSALHDATALHYVRTKRGRKSKRFEEINCWFLNNAITQGGRDTKRLDISATDQDLPESIRADELLNILWLSCPAQDIGTSLDELSDIGLNGLVSLTLNDSLPKASIIKELDDNMMKYVGEGISELDIMLVSTRIVNRQLNNIQELNRIGSSNREEFIKRIKDESEKQREEEENRTAEVTKWYERMSKEVEHYERVRADLSRHKTEIKDERERLAKDLKAANDERAAAELEIERLKQDANNREQELAERKKEKLLVRRVVRWRRMAWGYFLGLLILGVLLWSVHLFSGSSEWLRGESPVAKFLSLALPWLRMAYLALLGTFLGVLVTRYHNESVIKAFEERVQRKPSFRKELEQLTD